MNKRRQPTTTSIEEVSPTTRVALRDKKSPPMDSEGRDLPRVSFGVYTNAGGRKFDQLAGFEHYVKAHGLNHLTMVEWETAFLAFMGRPVG